MHNGIKAHKMTTEGLSNLGAAAHIIGFTLGRNPEGSLAPKRVKLYTELLQAFSNEDLAQVQRMLVLIVDVAPSETSELAAVLRTDGKKFHELLQEFPPTEAAHWQTVRRELTAGWGDARTPLATSPAQAGYGNLLAQLFPDVSGSIGPSPEEMARAAQMHDSAEDVMRMLPFYPSPLRLRGGKLLSAEVLKSLFEARERGDVIEFGTFGVRLDSSNVRAFLKDTDNSPEVMSAAMQRVKESFEKVKVSSRRFIFFVTDGNLPEEPKR